MNKLTFKLIVPILALLMLLSMASCVKACVFSPPTKTPITAVDITLVTDSATAKYVVCNNIEDEFFKSSGTIAIYKGTYSYTTLPTTPIAIVSFVDTWWGTYNIATNVGSYTAYEVWILSTGGTFVGFDHPVIATGDFLSTLTGYASVTALSSHVTIIGTGTSTGQVINLATPNIFVYPWTGYW